MRTAKLIPITADQAREIYQYSPDKGRLIRRTVRGGKAIGSVAGTVNPNGRRYVYVKGYHVLEHRLVWLMHHGEWPSGDIDHINGDPSDNRIENLRLATHFQNMGNAKKRKDNTTGYKGVKFQGGRWQARIGASGSITLGTFDTAEEAAEAYKKASRERYGEFARAE